MVAVETQCDTAGHATVNRIGDVKVGDRVWLYDTQATRYTANGKYEGRGVWRLVAVEQIKGNKLHAFGDKFSRSGIQLGTRGYSPSTALYGEQDRIEAEWIDTRAHVSRAILNCEDPVILARVAEILGVPRGNTVNIPWED